MRVEAPFAVAARFNACVGSSDLEGLALLMTEDHKFVDSAGLVLQGKATVLDAWRRFFAEFPGYRNEFSRHRETSRSVVIEGRSAASDSRLSGNFLWKAVIREGLVAEWHVFIDTAANRGMLGL